MNELTEFEGALGLVFSDKSLLQRALVHRSYLNEHPDFPLEDNERLEFLGDAVLGFVTGGYLYHRFPELAEGALTSLRSALVRREALAHFALGFDLGQHLLMSVGEASSGGRERPAMLCAAFEALVGAIYLDQGLAAVQRFVEPIVGPAATRILEEQSDKDYKSRLSEVAQGRLHHTPRYLTVSASGPDHARWFTVQVVIGETAYGEGSGPSKQQASQEAAREALRRIESEAAETPEAGTESPPDPGGAAPCLTPCC
jgi:ribonuclease-3